MYVDEYVHTDCISIRLQILVLFTHPTTRILGAVACRRRQSFVVSLVAKERARRETLLLWLRRVDLRVFDELTSTSSSQETNPASRLVKRLLSARSASKPELVIERRLTIIKIVASTLQNAFSGRVYPRIIHHSMSSL